MIIFPFTLVPLRGTAPWDPRATALALSALGLALAAVVILLAGHPLLERTVWPYQRYSAAERFIDPKAVRAALDAGVTEVSVVPWGVAPLVGARADFVADGRKREMRRGYFTTSWRVALGGPLPVLTVRSAPERADEVDAIVHHVNIALVEAARQVRLDAEDAARLRLIEGR